MIQVDLIIKGNLICEDWYCGDILNIKEDDAGPAYKCSNAIIIHGNVHAKNFEAFEKVVIVEGSLIAKKKLE